MSGGAPRLVALAVLGGNADPFQEALTRALPAADWELALVTIPATADEDAVETSFDSLVRDTDEFGGLVLVANVQADAVPLADTGPADWERGLGAPLRTAFLVVRRTLDEFLAGSRGGRIVLVAPTPAAPGTVAAALTSGLASLSTAIALEYGRRGISCNALVVPADRQPADAVAETVRFLLSPDSGYVTGDTIDLR
jgi:NAD(P)-dependent dehydrogenase (short-subunit alcohol dehydrogenase family)